MVDKIQSIMGTALTLASGISIPADIIVQAREPGSSLVCIALHCYLHAEMGLIPNSDV